MKGIDSVWFYLSVSVLSFCIFYEFRETNLYYCLSKPNGMEKVNFPKKLYGTHFKALEQF